MLSFFKKRYFQIQSLIAVSLHLDRRKKIQILSLCVAIGFVLAVGYHYYLGYYYSEPYPANTFLFRPGVHSSDFYDVVRDGHTLNPYLQYKSAQYPFLVLLGFLFSLMPYRYYLFILFFVSVFLISNMAHFRLENWIASANPVFILTFLSYPFLIAVDRGNFEIMVFVFLLAFMYFYAKKRFIASVIFLSFAISMKLYPAILLVLFIPEKRVREILICIASTAAITFVSLLCFKGGLLPNLTFLLQGSNIGANPLFSQFTSLSSNMVQRGVSLLTFLKILSFSTGLFQGVKSSLFLTCYLFLAGALGILIVLDVIFIEKEMWKRFALLIFAMLLLPHISADYKLLHIFIPIYLFINTEHPSRFDILYLLAFAMLLIPKDYYYFPNLISDAGSMHDVSLSTFLNILIMAVITLAILINGLIQKIQNPQGLPDGSSSILHSGVTESRRGG
jgi:hypothetical protein